MGDKADKQWHFPADSAARGKRLDTYLAGQLREEGVSRGKVKDWIEKGLCQMSGKVCAKPKTKLTGYEEIQLSGSVGADLPEAEEGTLHVLYEDESLAVIEKEAGLTTHPSPGQMGHTLVSRLLAKFPDMQSAESGMDGLRPGIVHRLDKETSGVMVVARNERVRLKLSEAFAERTVDKAYLALVHGVPKEPEAIIEAPIGRHPTVKTKMAIVDGARDARSAYKVLWTDRTKKMSLVGVKIFTGRTHQIRVHMAGLGHPLLGDAIYGSKAAAHWRSVDPKMEKLAKRQMLHAFRLSFMHPDSEEQKTLSSLPPEDFMTLFKALGGGCLRVALTGMPGCGKSTAMKGFKKIGVPVFSADAYVKELYAPHGDGTDFISKRFGYEVAHPDKGVDTRALFEAMAENPQVRREVEGMIHPMVRHGVEAFYYKNRHADLAIAEIPLLHEGGWSKDDDMIDVAIGVECSDEFRSSLLRGRGVSESMQAQFESWQWSQKDKLAACDIVFSNDDTVASLTEKTCQVRSELLQIAKEKNESFETRLVKYLSDLCEKGLFPDDIDCVTVTL
ncbi:MAG: dephospho-CoA kinase [Desulfovibrio sp.]